MNRNWENNRKPKNLGIDLAPLLIKKNRNKTKGKYVKCKFKQSLKVSAHYLKKELRKSEKHENVGIDLAPQMTDGWTKQCID